MFTNRGLWFAVAVPLSPQVPDDGLDGMEDVDQPSSAAVPADGSANGSAITPTSPVVNVRRFKLAVRARATRFARLQITRFGSTSCCYLSPGFFKQ